MTAELASLAIITLVATITPILARLVPNQLIPETVFLLFGGAIIGPHLLDWVNIGDAISLLSDLGLGFLFLHAGFEINPKELVGHQGKRGFGTWVITFAIAGFVVILWPAFSINSIDGLAVCIALTTTAIGTLMPILQERNLLHTPLGSAILSYGTWGELCPVIAMALLLSTRTTIQSIIILATFLIIALLVAVFAARIQKREGLLVRMWKEGANTAQQTLVRIVMLFLVGLTALSAIFNLDIVLGAFAAGFILRYVTLEGDELLTAKLDGLAFGFFIPLFFVVSGASIDLHAVLDRPDLLVFFIVLLLLVRALPIFVALSTDKQQTDLSRSGKVTVALYCTTALPIIVAVCAVAVDTGTMSQETSSVLISAGAITVLLMPIFASLTYRYALSTEGKDDESQIDGEALERFDNPDQEDESVRVNEREAQADDLSLEELDAYGRRDEGESNFVEDELEGWSREKECKTRSFDRDRQEEVDAANRHLPGNERRRHDDFEYVIRHGDDESTRSRK